MLALLTGWLAGYNRLRKAGFLALLPALMSLDTGYIVTRHVDLYDAKAVYRSNSLIEFLKQQSPAPRIKILSNQSLLRYWCNTVFPDSGVQQIDVMAESRLPSDKAFFLQSLGNNPLRYWQLTSTQFVLADHAVWMSLKSHPELAGAMTPAYPFTAQQKQDGSVETLPFPVTETAPFLLLRLNDALPRAALYTRWEILPDIPATGQRLAELSFNPKETVLLSNPAVPDSESGTDESSITPEITHYSPHRIDIRIPPQPSGTILLLNERYDPDWKVSIDGNSAQILRGNYLMRAVYVPPQRQTVSFTYEPNARLVHLSGITILLLTLASVTSGLLRFWRKAE
jgi:hypothetical protein